MSKNLNKGTKNNEEERLMKELDLINEIMAEDDGFEPARMIEEGTIMVFKCKEMYVKEINGVNRTFIRGDAKFILDKTIKENMEIMVNPDYTFKHHLGKIVGGKYPMIFRPYTKADGTKDLTWDIYRPMKK